MWAFTMTLGYSRRMMAEAATDQQLGTLLRMHEAAFRQWEGVPEEILYDRMKTVWTGTDERGEIIWNTVFLDFARYWGFTPRLCRAVAGDDAALGVHQDRIVEAEFGNARRDLRHLGFGVRPGVPIEWNKPGDRPHLDALGHWMSFQRFVPGRTHTVLQFVPSITGPRFIRQQKILRAMRQEIRAGCVRETLPKRIALSAPSEVHWRSCETLDVSFC